MQELQRPMPSEQELLAQLNSVQPAMETGPDWWRVILSLLLVIGLAVWVLKQLRPWLQAQKGLAGAVPPEHRIVLLHSVRLGGGNALHTVRINGQILLVSSGSAGSPQLIKDLGASD
jgi:hypothetical protein